MSSVQRRARSRPTRGKDVESPVTHLAAPCGCNACGMTDDIGRSVDDYVASLADQQTIDDSRTLIEVMGRISGKAPTLWNVGTIGFGTYHYKYDSGREGDGHTIGFYPRKGKLTIYLMDGTTRHSALLGQLGTHTTTGYCVYIRRLSDVDLPVLERIIQDSYDFIEAKAEAGPIREILWKAEG
jgi:hypothetical protein